MFIVQAVIPATLVFVGFIVAHLFVRDEVLASICLIQNGREIMRTFSQPR